MATIKTDATESGPLTSPTPETTAKFERVETLLQELGSVVVAFSGGVDSTLLLKAAKDSLGDRVIAAVGLSATYAAEEINDARELAEQLGVEFALVETMELTDSRYASNNHQRCYFCKSELYTKLGQLQHERGFSAIVDGANADDLADFRPGARAARELGVRSPLQEAGLTKPEIRALSAELGLPTWDKPAAACLSSRFSYGDPITVEKLRKVAAAERNIRDLGFRGFRVRHHDALARLEFPIEQLAEALAQREQIVAAVKAAGYQYVALDLEGYRTGSQNEVLNARLKSSGLRRSSSI